MNLLDYLILPFGWLISFLYKIIGDYGIALLMFTVIIRLVLLPLAVKQQKGQAEMVRMQPKLNALQKKYAKDKQKLQQEQTRLMTEEGYNPLSGCLPMLVQMPILVILYQALVHPLVYIAGMPRKYVTALIHYLGYNATNSPHRAYPDIGVVQALQDPTTFDKLAQRYTWLHDFQNINFNLFHIPALNLALIPGYKWSLYLLSPILCFATSMLSTWLSMKITSSYSPQAAQQQGMTKSMLFIAPAMSAFFAFQVPMALGLYWIYTNLLMMLQVVLLNKFYNPKKLAEESEARAEQRRLARGLAAQPVEDDEPVEEPAAAQKKPSGQGRPQQAQRKPQQPGTYKKPSPTPSGKLTNKQRKQMNRRLLAEARKKQTKPNDK